jgi:uncharacterized membrane protein|tara:strand:- start:1421 stop:1702 length:282 start_codon:yes stop_codon:yes gene_type:complete
LEEQEGFWENLSTLTKMASVFFILGKVMGFMTFFTFFVNLMLAKWMLVVYAIFIAISVLLSGYQMFRGGKQDRKPTKEQVEEWAREYRLLEGK